MINNITENLKKTFCKLYGIPINIYVEPYFSERVELFDTMYNSKEKWDMFLNDLEKFDTKTDFFDEKDNVFDAAVYHIKSSEGYRHFNDINMKLLLPSNNKTKKDIFHKENDLREFISIDMKHANFTALKTFCSDIFNDLNNWNDFMSQFTDLRTLKESKYFRQIILGNCNSKRQISYEEYIMNNILNLVISKFINIEKLVFFSQDEIIFDVTDWPEAKLQYDQLKKYLKDKYIELYTDEQMQNKKIPLKVEYFKLHKINGIKGCYKEIFNDDESISYKFKCVEPNMYPLILRKFNNEEIQENDKVFLADQTLAKYVNIPEFNI